LQPSPVGWVSGVVYDHLGNPAPEATVKVLDTPLEPVDTAPDGSYTIELPGNASYDLQAWAEGSGTQTVTDVNITPGNTTIVDFNLPLDPIYLPTPPDGYGYMIYDMHDAGGPGYTWNSIAGVGTPISLSDDSYQNVACSFSFGFYGTTYNSMTVGSNGFITPGTNGYTNYANSCIPNSYVPGSVYPHWDDINPASGGNIYYYDDTANHRFIVEFNAVPYYSNSGTVTMQIVCLDPSTTPHPRATPSGSFITITWEPSIPAPWVSSTPPGTTASSTSATDFTTRMLTPSPMSLPYSSPPAPWRKTR